MSHETTAQLRTPTSGGGAAALHVAKRYFDAWNGRDAEAIVACFAKGGTYSDPAVSRLSGPAIGAYAQGLWAAFPDLSFEIVTAGAVGVDRVAAQWIMRGTNTGSMQGLPPTGRVVELPGADFIRIEGDTIKSVEGYFDQQAVPLQLGLMSVVQPREVGPFVFGTSTGARSGKRIQPGAFSITALQVRNDEEVERVRASSRQIVQDMLAMPGFIGWTGAVLGDRMLTITAWETAEHSRQLSKNATHHAAMMDFHNGNLAVSGWVSTWVPAEIKPTWVRCTECQRMMNHEKGNGVCSCGASLPEPPPYW